jgi:hypothetical protein
VWEQGATGRFALEDTLVLDTPAWSAWLDDPGTRSFAFPVYDPVHGYIAGFMTVRKEPRQRGGAYWSAYWRLGGRARKAYVGVSCAVTAARLQAIAHTWSLQAQRGEPR